MYLLVLLPQTPKATPQARTSLPSAEKVPTPIPSCEMSFARRSSTRSRNSNSSLMSIKEEDETTVSPSPRKRRWESPAVVYDLVPITSADESAPKLKRSRKSVTFGPMLSPEVFDKNLPPSTPMKPGTDPMGQRRSISTKLTLDDVIEEEIDASSSESESEIDSDG